MTLDEIREMIRAKPGKKFRLKDHDPRWSGDTEVSKKERKAIAAKLLTEDVTQLAQAQNLLYAADTYAILLVFQAMDAAGKDSTIKHVMSGINPQGCQVYSFKHPSPEELDHDFLWRCTKALPERGRIGIFNRSYYEEVLVVKVHDEIQQPAHSRAKPSKELWQTLDDINRASPDPERHGDSQVLLASFQGRTAQAFSGTIGRSRQALEVFRFGHERTRLLG